MRTSRVVFQLQGYLRDIAEQLDGVGAVDFIGRVAGLVIIGVQAGEKNSTGTCADVNE